MSKYTEKELIKLKHQDTILTRHKTSQMKSGQRNVSLTKDSPNFSAMNMQRQYPGKKLILKTNLKKVTKKTPSKYKKPTEYYPSKQRRDIRIRPIVLRPKNKLVVVAEINKRKRCTPRKGVSTTPSPQPANVEPKQQQPEPKQQQQQQPEPKEESIEELIRLTETEGLTDEDLIEILTCPSPVWWEPCDYDEEPIMRRDEISIKEAENPQTDIVNNDYEDSKHFVINKIKSDDRFMKKRLVLENLLNNIKKNVNEISDTKESVDDKDSREKDTKKDKKSHQNAPKTDVNMTYKELLKKREYEVLKKIENNSVADKSVTVGDKYNDLSADKDNSVSDSDVVSNTSDESEPLNYNHLNKNVKKNNEIVPGHDKMDEGGRVNENTRVSGNGTKEMKDTKAKKDRLLIEKSEFSEKNEEKCQNIDDNKDINVKSKDENQAVVRKKDEYKRKRTTSLEDLENIDIPIGKKPKKYDENLNRGAKKDEIPKVPDNLPQLKLFGIHNSPESMKIIDLDNDSSSVSIHDGLDTISDTNIQFLNEDQLSEDSVSISESIEAINEEDLKNNSKNDDYVVIYKVVETGVDLENERPNAESTEPDSLKKKSTSPENGGKTKDVCKSCVEKAEILIRVENEELMHYCTKCSSIYITESCTFCVNKNTDNELSLVCQICMCECCCEDNLKIHVTNHIGSM